MLGFRFLNLLLLDLSANVVYFPFFFFLSRFILISRKFGDSCIEHVEFDLFSHWISCSSYYLLILS